jgi:hypothetical protein
MQMCTNSLQKHIEAYMYTVLRRYVSMHTERWNVVSHASTHAHLLAIGPLSSVFPQWIKHEDMIHSHVYVDVEGLECTNNLFTIVVARLLCRRLGDAEIYAGKRLLQPLGVAKYLL